MPPESEVRVAKISIGHGIELGADTSFVLGVQEQSGLADQVLVSPRVGAVLEAVIHYENKMR